MARPEVKVRHSTPYQQGRESHSTGSHPRPPDQRTLARRSSCLILPSPVQPGYEPDQMLLSPALQVLVRREPGYELGLGTRLGYDGKKEIFYVAVQKPAIELDSKSTTRRSQEELSPLCIGLKKEVDDMILSPNVSEGGMSKIEQLLLSTFIYKFPWTDDVLTLQ